MAGGRPTVYDPKFCDMLVKHMEEGLSFESFAGVIDVGREAIYRWLDVHPEFSDARDRGRSKGMLFDEKVLRGLIVGKYKNGSVHGQSNKMRLKYRQDWGDEESAANGGIVINYIKDER